ncbi:alpha/beta hydrolase [Streptomyces hygroscopicus subsp. hygroscopicus]|nr:alpha/beta hydrolase [Streptomyces hygroscopicus]GLX49421.1 alpha/beta hydrolase [Streptomyces hygroscopicus subsp. hygroscopicus]
MHGTAPVPLAVVLVHGAFAGASSWAKVIGLLHAAGLAVLAPANPLRGLAHDAAYIRSVLRQIDVPVVLVGHGYGGAVVTEAAADAENVVALCYVAAFGLDAGECPRDVIDRFAPMPAMDSAFTAAVSPRFSGGPGSELYIRGDRFPQTYAADLPLRVARGLSVTQRPVAQDALTGRSGPPAWASRPSWYAIAAADRMLNPAAQRFMAQRMAATEHVLPGSHAVVLSHPEAVAVMIKEAAGQSGDRGGGYGLQGPFEQTIFRTEE